MFEHLFTRGNSHGFAHYLGIACFNELDHFLAKGNQDRIELNGKLRRQIGASLSQCISELRALKCRLHATESQDISLSSLQNLSKDSFINFLEKIHPTRKQVPNPRIVSVQIGVCDLNLLI